MLNLGLITGSLITLMIFISGCVPPAEDGGEGGFDWTIIIFLLLIFGVFYFLMIRPQRKRQKEHDQLMQELQKGDKVITAGGIYGVVESLSDESIVIKTESGATIRVARGSVAGRREK
ncbi:preprotein translocase subunit YajC [Chloroflexota bacterium]